MNVKHTVTGEIGSFKMGQVIADMPTLVSYFRTVANEGAYKPTELSDADIQAIIEANPNGTDESPDDWEITIGEAIERGEVPTSESKSIAASSQEAADAREVAAVVIADSEALEHIQKRVDSDEYSKGSAKVVYLDFVRLGIVDKLRLPGSTLDGRKVGGNPSPISNNPDLSWRPGRTARNTPTQVRVSWVETFASQFPAAVSAIAAMEKAKEAVAAKTLSKFQGERVEKREGARLRSVVKVVTDAMRLHFQIAAASDYPSCSFQWDTEKVYNKMTKQSTEHHVSTASPCIVSDPSAPLEAFALSVSQFLSLDFERAKEGVGDNAPGSFGALMATMRREKQDRIADEIKDYAGLYGTALSFNLALDDADIFGELTKKVGEKKDGTFTAESDELLVLLDSIERNVGMAIDKYRNRLGVIKSKQEGARKVA